MHAEFGFFTAADPLRPGIAEQAVGEQSELMRLSAGGADVGDFCAEAILSQDDFPVAWWQVAVHAATGPRSGSKGFAGGSKKLQLHISQSRKTLVTHIANQSHHSLLFEIGFSIR